MSYIAHCLTARAVVTTFILLTCGLLQVHAAEIRTCRTPPPGSELWNPKPGDVVLEVIWDVFEEHLCHWTKPCRVVQQTEYDVTTITTQDRDTIAKLETTIRPETSTSVTTPPETTVQLKSVEMQAGNVLKFTPGNSMGSDFSMMVYVVDEEGFLTCNSSMGVAIIKDETNETFEVPPHYLDPGTHYFIGASNVSLSASCEYGLRLNVTVKANNCHDSHVSPCSGWGVCVTYPNEPIYKCHCCGTYKGAYCDIFDSCLSNPCLNGGLCYHPSKNNSVEFACECALGYYGLECGSKSENLCEMVDCYNNATCTGNSSHFRCHCPAGLTGTHCEVDINECEPQPCVNGGQCIDQRNGYKCQCGPGFHGDRCQLIHKPCSLTPCLNGGFCQNKTKDRFDFQCHCKPGWGAKDCSQKIPACDAKPCIHGTCSESEHGFTCSCASGFTGSRCEVNINDCDPNPCKYGGHCKDGVNSHTCMCIHSHAGSNCQFTLDIFSPILEDVDIAGGIIHNPAHTRNLYIAAGALTGAVLIMVVILVVCYCRISRTYISCCGLPRIFMYKKFHEDYIVNVDVTSSSDCPLAVDSYWRQIDSESEALSSSSSRSSFQNHTV